MSERGAEPAAGLSSAQFMVAMEHSPIGTALAAMAIAFSLITAFRLCSGHRYGPRGQMNSKSRLEAGRKC